MKKFRKILSAILALSVIAACATSCKKEEVKEQANLFNENGEFVPPKDMELTVWVTQGSDYVPPVQPKENLVQDWLVDKTRVSIKNTYGNGGGQWEAVLARLIAGDNFPELVACGGGQGPAHFSKISQADKIWELTPEMLEKYAPDIWKKVPQKLWDKMKIDGKIYGIPYNFAIDREFDPEITDEELEAWGEDIPSNMGTTLWIRDDILKMLYPNAKTYDELIALLEEKGAPIGDEIYDVPLESTEDIVKLMRDIKNLNLKVGDKEVYAYGYSGADCWVPFTNLGSVLSGYVGHNYITSWDTEQNKIVIPLLGDVIKESALLQNQLLREKVFDPESLVNTDAQCKEKILNGQYAITVLSAIEHPPFINEALAKAGKPFRYRPLYTRVPSKPGFGVCKKNLSWGNSVGILKAVKEEDLPQILNWMNVQFTDEWEEVRYWGPKEAGLYEDKEDGTRVFKDDRLNQKYIYHKESEIEAEECHGLNEGSGIFFMKFKQQSKWDPMMYNHVTTYVMVPANGGKLSVDSKYKVDPIIAPPSDVWAPEYGNLETVTKFWSSRSQWEDPFKLTLVAESDEEFNQKWDKAVENMKSVVDVEKMAEEMTEIAKELIK